MHVGKAPLGPLFMVIRNSTRSGLSPVSPAFGCSHGSSARPDRPCLRSSRQPRNAFRIHASRQTSGELSPHSCLSRSRSETQRSASAGSTGTCERGRASHALPPLQLLSADTALLRLGRPSFAIFHTAISSDTSVQSRYGICSPTSHGIGFASHAYGSPFQPQ